MGAREAAEMPSFHALMRLGRLKFIPSSFILALLGALSGDINGAACHGIDGAANGSAAGGGGLTDSVFRFRVEAFVPVAFIVACSHVMTHFCSEYFNYAADLANAQRGKWNGGSGVLPAGMLPRWTALVAASVLFAGSIGAQLAFFNASAQRVAWAAMFLSCAYAGPPFKLQYRGFGEATVAVVLTCCVPAMGALMQRRDDAFALPTSLRTIIPLLSVQQFVRMMVMNLPDIESDLQCGKITLTARMGPERVARVYRFAQYAIGVVAVGLFGSGHMTCPMLIAFLVATTNRLSLSRRLDEIVFGGAASGTTKVDHDARGKKCDTAAAITAAAGTVDPKTTTRPYTTTALAFGDLPYHATIHVASTALMLVVAQALGLMMQTQHYYY
ncbi:unnamed protein product [Closterium sp. Yama58-4]|nr:unnamed protein product [Closterium sp. Yama58-4]